MPVFSSSGSPTSSARSRRKTLDGLHPVLAGLIWALAALAVLLVIIAVISGWFSGLGFLASYDVFFRSHIVFWGPGCIALWTLMTYLYVDTSQKKRRILSTLSAVTVAVMVLGSIGYAVIANNYLSAKSHNQSLDYVTDEEQVTHFADRAPWNVADNYAQRDQGDIVGDRSHVQLVPDDQDAEAADGEGTSRYTTLVAGRAFLGMTGYQAVQTMHMPATGPIPQSASSHCEVPESMTKRDGSVWPWHALGWSVHAHKPTAHWDHSDVYAYCDDNDEPVIVIPLYRIDGVFITHRVADGAAIYTPDGVEILSPEQLVDNGIEGPTYPRSLASQQRDSLNAQGSLGDWWGKRFGYDSTSKDNEDTNTGNTTEFVLLDADGVMQYVSPLTPRGSSQSITAVSTVPAQQGHGQPTLRVLTSPDLGSTSTIATAIKESSVNGDNSWTNRWASGMSVYEILPGQDGHWVASIGQGQAVSYRADITPDGSVTVTNSETGQSSAGKDDDEDGDSVTVEGDKPLSEMSEAELLDRIEKATTELQEREKAEAE